MRRSLLRSLGTSAARPVANSFAPTSSFSRRQFHNTGALDAIKPYLLADIGEGITECQITSWLVKPGDRVQQFDAICEVQSDKASVEITSRFDGVIQKLHYEVDDMAAVGSPLLDIEVDDAEDGSDGAQGPQPQTPSQEKPPQEDQNLMGEDTNELDQSQAVLNQSIAAVSKSEPSAPKNSGLVIPAVRHMLKQYNLDIADIEGTGKAGRVLKEDVQRHLAAKNSSATPQKTPEASTPIQPQAEDQVVPLTPIQNQMFQSMTRSLAIPHFLYTQIVDMTDLTTLRKRFVNNPVLSSNLAKSDGSKSKLSSLPFVLKALSQAVTKFPTVNATLDTETNPGKPQLVIKGSHNIGVAMDTPKGLVVPVIKNIQNHSIVSLAIEIERLSALARDGKLSPEDMKGASLVVSNIGSIGGHTVGPVILSPNVMILGIGRSQHVPTYKTGSDGKEQIVKREQVVLSWSADHRVLDGATVARCAQSVGSWLENVDGLGLVLK